MSAAAEELAKACTHPKVKGSRRALLDTIAKLIPEAQTMTPPITLEELARLAGYYEMTFRQARDFLVTVGVLRIVGGGRGRPASYELLALPGAGDDPSLPLIGATPRRSRATPGPDLFDPPRSDQFADAVRGDDIGTKYRTPRSEFGRKYRTTRDQFGTFYRTCRRIVSEFGTFYRTRVTNVGRKYRTAHQVVDVDDARARDVQQLKTTTTTAPPANAHERRKPDRPRCRWHGTVHAWCEGRVHVPLDFHLEERRKLPRLAGETDEDLDAKLFARYARECAEVSDDDDLTGQTEFTFWKRRLRSAPAATAAPDQPRASRRQPRNELRIGGAVCGHEPRCESTKACLERILADGRAERERKSG
jgi:hypothetical protein